MNLRIKEWIKRHPIEAFFIVAIAIRDATLFSVNLFCPPGYYVGSDSWYYFAKIGIQSPASCEHFYFKNNLVYNLQQPSFLYLIVYDSLIHTGSSH